MKKHIRQSFDSKLLQTQGIVANWIRSCPPEKQAVGFSGGKDSTVVLQLVMGARRCGCMVCTAHKGWEDELSQTNPKMLRKILKDMGQEQLS